MSAPARRKKREEECWKQWRIAYLYFYRQNFAVILFGRFCLYDRHNALFRLLFRKIYEKPLMRNLHWETTIPVRKWVSEETFYFYYIELPNIFCLIFLFALCWLMLLQFYQFLETSRKILPPYNHRISSSLQWLLFLFPWNYSKCSPFSSFSSCCQCPLSYVMHQEEAIC